MNETNRIAAGCPSEFALDRLRLAELAPGQASVMLDHVAGCAACARRIEELSAAPPPFDLDGVWAAARPAGAPRVAAGWFRRLRDRWTLAFAGTAVVAAAAALVLALRPAAAPTDVVKGGTPWTLTVVVKRVGQQTVSRPASGVRLSAGDQLRFEVATSAPSGYAAVIGADSRGVVAPLAPAAGEGVLVRGGRPVVLDAAVELDDAPGVERIDLLGCPQPRPVTELVRAVRQAVEREAGDLDRIDGVSPGCHQQTFWIEKVKR